MDERNIDERLLDEDVEDEEEILPYSFHNDVSFFFRKGIPLGLSSTLEWGLPPWASMIFAGHTHNSELLQSAYGYGRVFYNCTVLMTMFGVTSYFNSVIPAAVGANRKDRIPSYFYRSMLYCTIFIIPFFVLQFFSGDILHSFGVNREITNEIDIYTRLMIISSWLLLLEAHLETIFINLEYANLAACNSLFTGMVIDIGCTYLFIYKLEYGMTGAAYAQIVVKTSRVCVWLVATWYYNLYDKILKHDKNSKEFILSKKEFKSFVGLGLPQIISNFMGWFIFELQLVFITRIKEINKAALAAGAIWVQTESTMAAIQSGWINAAKMRVLNLLGKGDHISAVKSLKLNMILSASCVFLGNVLLFSFRVPLSQLVSNEKVVQEYFSSFIWILCIHTQVRITVINLSCILIPIGRGIFANVSKISNYMIGVPLIICIGLTNTIYGDGDVFLVARMSWIFSLSPVNMSIRILIVGIFLGCFLDWQKATKIVVERANQDKCRLLSDNEEDGYQPIFNDNDEVEEESTTIEFMRI